MEDVIARAALIKLVIFDVDGVLTDGSLFLGDDGLEYKAFNSRDGLGMTMLLASGIDIGIITARTSNVVAVRMQSLGIKHVYQGQLDKRAGYEKMRAALGLEHTQIAYVGDDLIDLPVMTEVGLSIATADAHPVVKSHSHWQTPSYGGRGAGRDTCELIMRAQDTFNAALSRYLAPESSTLSLSQ